MIEDRNIETYLYVTPRYLKIFLFDTEQRNNLYEEEFEFENESDQIDFKNLSNFLEKNIFKIEKIIGKFITNIYLILESNKIINRNFGIKKKNYEKKIDKKFIENLLTDAKDLFKENYNNEKIMHILIKNYLLDGVSHISFEDNFHGDLFCLELQIKSISRNFIFEINKLLEKYQIQVIDYMDGKYIRNFFLTDNILFSEMVYKIKDGFNDNEVKLVPKNTKKASFFEKFFQLFS